jgi:hypothetical protein
MVLKYFQYPTLAVNPDNTYIFFTQNPDKRITSAKSRF